MRGHELGTGMRVQTETVELVDGWSASVVTRIDGTFADAGALVQLPSAEQWRSLLTELVRSPADLPEYSVLKYSEGAEVFRARLKWAEGAIEVVCKHTDIDGGLRGLLGRWRVPREKRDFDRGLELMNAGIGTAQPLALLESGGRRRETRVVTAFLADAVDLDQVALTLMSRLEPGRRRAVKDELIARVADLFARLWARGYYHRDLKASNILVTDWDESPRVWVVDLEGLRHRRVPDRRQQRQPLVRLAASLQGYAAVTRTDRARFLRAYLDLAQNAGVMWKEQYRELGRQATDYVRRARGRKTHKLDGFADGA